jgi:DNA-binding transcriptional MerR regulator
MAWSTSELADLAGTTVNTVRHYHRVGLLEQPERRANGYKQYRARHLARVIQIRRLRELGVPLAEIGSLGAAGGDAAGTLRALDVELAASIERLQRARTELAVVLRDRASLDVPPEFSSVEERLTDADRALVTICTQFYDQDALDDIRRMIEVEPTDIDRDFTALPPDASEATRRDLVERMVPLLDRHLADHPWLSDPLPRLSTSATAARDALHRVLPDLYNGAQRDVLRRAMLVVLDPPT